MKNLNRSDFAFYFFLVAISTIYYFGIKDVPFHPDESTQIFMSGDVQLFIQSPRALFWDEKPADPIRQKYRELDAPITRSLIGIWRQINGLPNLQNDWTWGNSWLENNQNGALPNQNLLLFSRFIIASLFPLSLLLVYRIGITLQNRTLGWIAAGLFAFHPLILLHTRRAMAESALIFTILLCLFTLLNPPKNLWLLSVPIAFAFNSKQTAVGLLVAGVCIILIKLKNAGIKEYLKILLFYALGFCFITLLLNPFLWSNPYQAGISALNTRAKLTEAQKETFASFNESLVLNTIPNKLTAFIANTINTQPQIAETNDYMTESFESVSKYLRSGINSLLVHPTMNFVFAILGGCGVLIALILIRLDREKSLEFAIFLITFLCVSLSLLIFLSLSFQRYYLPAIPFLCLFTALTITKGVSQLRTIYIKLSNR